jgi:NitT/TauT family transport system substrate-binding protein/sulfonate transport system substrate-binding protein
VRFSARALPRTRRTHVADPHRRRQRHRPCAAFIGVERGIFAKHGLDAKIVMYQTGPEMINGLLNGAQDVNIMGSIPFLAGVSRGQPLVLIGHLHGDATRQYYADNNSVVAGPKSGIKANDFKALKGRRIGLPRGTGAEGYLLGLLAENGMKDADVTLINVKPSDQATALRQGDVDAIAAWEPWATTAVERVPGAVRVVSGGCESCYDPGSILTSRDVIAQKAEALRRFMVAFAEAEQWLRTHFDEAAEINMRWVTGTDADIMKSAIRRSHYDLRVSRNTSRATTARRSRCWSPTSGWRRACRPRASSTAVLPVRREDGAAVLHDLPHTAGPAH